MQPQTTQGETSPGSFLSSALDLVGQLILAIRQSQSPDATLGNLPDAALITSSNGQVLYANTKHTELFTGGESPVGKDCHRLPA